MKRRIYFTWIEYFWSFVVLSLLGALPAIFYGAQFREYIFPFGLYYALYWLIVAAGFTFLTNHQRRKAYEDPMMILGEATRKVASGDFSIYLKPIRSLSQANYINEMFKDFNKMVEALGSLETMKTDFIASVSHEIKTPLASIQGYARMLQKPQLSEEERLDYTHFLMQSSQNLSVLVTNILQLSKLENQGIISSHESYNVCEQLSECIISFVDMWEAKNINYEINIEDVATLYQDPAIVSIIWRNLLSNATKFTDAKGTISITQTSTDKGIVVRISDSGVGMSNETKQRLFEKFYQGDTSRFVQGNGLGMALVARCVELLNGTIDVDSELGVGTTFTVHIDTQR
ncbi:hypothetical protein AOC36_11380 [Erysipelothrix larvae]|uniref:histidine kinase n=1 Tax=Erysipelothrix larvae TaxID=1514105 RepID=A0A0X8H200_9FIRM|nr:HAMP domain-containing sensor histidine kinase [Erysipelothrix larvae]AMC94551.1 hypothetical protein AOC36_11380 [Erysipelothrix larvae]